MDYLLERLQAETDFLLESIRLLELRKLKEEGGVLSGQDVTLFDGTIARYHQTISTNDRVRRLWEAASDVE